MGSPILVILLAIADVVLVAAAIWLRPPLTIRGRVFYAITGGVGLSCGAFLLVWIATACEYGRPHPSSVPDKTMLEVLGQMFVFGSDGYGFSSLIACVVSGVGVWFCVKAATKCGYREN